MIQAKRIALFSAASALALLSAGVASAAPATTESSVNMRTGPGTQYEVIATLPGGVPVDVAGCTGRWCQIVWNGQSGYVAASYLDMAGSPGPAVAVAPPLVDSYSYDDDYYDSGYPYAYSYGYGPSIGIYGGYGGRRWYRDHRYGWNRPGWQSQQSWQGRPGWQGQTSGSVAVQPGTQISPGAGPGGWQGRTVDRTPGSVAPRGPQVGGGVQAGGSVRAGAGSAPAMSAPAGMRSGGGPGPSQAAPAARAGGAGGAGAGGAPRQDGR